MGNSRFCYFKKDCPNFTLNNKKLKLLGASLGLPFSIIPIVMGLIGFFAFFLFFNPISDIKTNKTSTVTETQTNNISKPINAIPGNITNTNYDIENKQSLGLSETIVNLISSIFQLPFLVPFMFFFVGCHNLYKSIKVFLIISKNKQLSYLSDGFKDKYVLLDVKDYTLLGKVFNKQVCDKILNYESEIIELSCNKNCLQYNCVKNTELKMKDQQLSVDKAKRIIEDLVNKAKIFDEK